MELIYVALLLHKSGKEINEANVKKVVDAVGISANDQEIKALINAFDGVDIEKEIKEAAVVTSAPAADVKTEGKKEEKSEEEEKKDEAAASAGLASLFG